MIHKVGRRLAAHVICYTEISRKNHVSRVRLEEELVMRRSEVAKGFALGMLLLATVDAFACGESLFRVGKGVNYRNYFAPIPGRIIAVAKTNGELAMVERLSAAGHDVHVVSSPDEISETLAAEHDFDVVLALYSQRDTVEKELSGYTATYLPVAREGTEEVARAHDAYAYSLQTDDSVKQFLKTIHRTLKQRQV